MTEVDVKLIYAITALVWSLFFFVLIIKSKSGVGKFFETLSNAIVRAQTIKIPGGFTMTMNDVAAALEDREVLKISILVALSDLPKESQNKPEIVKLRTVALSMDDHLVALTTPERKRMLDTALRLAGEDDEITENELKSLHSIREHYDLKPTEFNKLIENFKKIRPSLKVQKETECIN